MQKIDVYSLESGLENLRFLSELPSVIIGYQKLTRGAHFHLTSGSEVEMIQVEVYCKQIPDDIIAKLDQISTVVATHYSSCTEIDLDSIIEVSDGKKSVKIAEVQNSAEPTLGTAEVDDGLISIEVKDMVGGKSVFSITASRKLGFLYKVFGVLAQNDIHLFKGNCCPKGEHIIGRFVVNRMNAELLTYMEGELERVLASSMMSNGGYKKFVRPDMGTSTLGISFDASGSLPSIKVSAGAKESLIRYQVQEVLATFDLEVSIGRIGSRGGMIDDQYYLKSTKNFEIDQHLINELENFLFRK